MIEVCFYKRLDLYRALHTVADALLATGDLCGIVYQPAPQWLKGIADVSLEMKSATLLLLKDRAPEEAMIVMPFSRYLELLDQPGIDQFVAVEPPALD